MKYIIISNSPSLIQQVVPFENISVMIDIETIGKKDRQPANSFFSTHKIEDIEKVNSFLDKTRTILRINPMHAGSEKEIELGISLGAGNIMLPMYSSTSDIETFVDFVKGRAQHIFLAETPWSVEEACSYTANLPTGSSVHFGLNDLHLALNAPHMFQILSSGYLERAIKSCQKNKVAFGIGGIGLGSKDAVAPSLIAQYHCLLKSNCVILSRSFKARAEEIGFERSFREVESFFTGPDNSSLEDVKSQILSSTMKPNT